MDYIYNLKIHVSFLHAMHKQYDHTKLCFSIVSVIYQVHHDRNIVTNSIIHLQML